MGSSLTLALCFFGLMAGLIQRWTHRYKLLQIIGLGIKIIGMGLLVSGGKGTTNIVNFVFIQRTSFIDIRHMMSSHCSSHWGRGSILGRGFASRLSSFGATSRSRPCYL